MSVPLIALKPLVYAGRRIRQNDRFAARGEQDARVLLAIGSAARDSSADVVTHNRALAPAVTKPVMPAQYVAKVDGADVVLDTMERDDLVALATKLGIEFHPLLGAPKLRKAICEAQ